MVIPNLDHGLARYNREKARTEEDEKAARIRARYKPTKADIAAQNRLEGTIWKFDKRGILENKYLEFNKDSLVEHVVSIHPDQYPSKNTYVILFSENSANPNEVAFSARDYSYKLVFKDKTHADYYLKGGEISGSQWKKNASMTQINRQDLDAFLHRQKN